MSLLDRVRLRDSQGSAGLASRLISVKSLASKAHYVTGCDSVIANCEHVAKLLQEWRVLREMTRQNVLDCKPVDLFLVLAHIENKVAQAWLQEFYGRQKIPMDPKATLSEHQLPVINDGYAMLDRFIFENLFGSRYLSNTKNENPTPHISRYDDHSPEQYVALNIDLIVLLNQHGDAFKQLMQRKATLTKRPSSQALFNNHVRRFLLPLCAPLRGTSRAEL